MAVAKRLFFDVPGFGRVHAMPGGSIKPAGLSRKKKMSDLGSAGSESEPMPGELKFKIVNQPGISLVALGQLESVDVTVQDDSGKTWLCVGCDVTDQPTLSGGEIDMTMEFDTQQEVL